MSDQTGLGHAIIDEIVIDEGVIEIQRAAMRSIVKLRQKVSIVI